MDASVNPGMALWLQDIVQHIGTNGLLKARLLVRAFTPAGLC